MNTSNTQNSEDILTPAQFLEWFLSPKTVEGRFVIGELDQKIKKEALDLRSFFTEDDTKQLFDCVDPQKCLYIIDKIIDRIRWEQAEVHMSSNQKQKTIERFYAVFSWR